jgi:hypothetical protein
LAVLVEELEFVEEEDPYEEFLLVGGFDIISL